MLGDEPLEMFGKLDDEKQIELTDQYLSERDHIISQHLAELHHNARRLGDNLIEDFTEWLAEEFQQSRYTPEFFGIELDSDEEEEA
jgi:hypothetical protein